LVVEFSGTVRVLWWQRRDSYSKEQLRTDFIREPLSKITCIKAELNMWSAGPIINQFVLKNLAQTFNSGNFAVIIFYLI
jgi:hypothetical protein